MSAAPTARTPTPTEAPTVPTDLAAPADRSDLGPRPHDAGERPDRPVVTVVVPMLNESGTIERCLDAFAAQTYPVDRLDVVVVDGGSTDGSRAAVEAYALDHPWVRVVDNPRKKASAAFNLGVEHARGEVLMLFSAHGVPHADYVETSVAVLAETGVEGVGGQYHHVGTDPTSQAIGLAMVSPVGMASPHRFARTRREVDTISHPAYRTEALRRVGPFDETLERNSDYELNHRMRDMGMTLLFDPSVESIYRPRPSLKALARQFWWYGRWKRRVIARHPGSLRARHLVAPAAVAGASLTPILVLHPSGRRAVAVGAALYGGVVAAGVVHARPWRHGASTATLAAALPTMHAAWGAGFLTSVVTDAIGGRDR